MSRVPFVHVDAILAGAHDGDPVPLAAGERHHLERVLRLSTGAEMELADGIGTVAPAALSNGAAVLTADAVTTPPPRPALEVAQALARGRRVDEVVRAVTELGADAVTPVLAARSVARPDAARAARTMARWRTVARGACEQSRRVWRPRIDEIAVPEELVSDEVRLLVAEPGATPLPQVMADLAGTAVVRIAIGPEGGWRDDELRALREGGARLVGLGPTVLRTEHAAVAALAVLAAGLGRWTLPARHQE